MFHVWQSYYSCRGNNVKLYFVLFLLYALDIVLLRNALNKQRKLSNKYFIKSFQVTSQDSGKFT